MPIHAELTGSDLHEPKGQSGAALNTLYVADGSGSGTHKKITPDSLDLTSMVNPNEYSLSSVLDDVSEVSSVLIPIPNNSTFVSARLVLETGITVADATVSFTRNDGSSFGTAVTITQAASAEGTGFTFTPTLNQTITGPGYIKVTSDGGSTTASKLSIVVKLQRIL